MIQTILLVISNLAWLVFIYLIYKDLRKGLSSPHFDIIVNLMDDKGKTVKSIEMNDSEVIKKNEKIVDEEQGFESLANVPFSDVVNSLEKEIEENKKLHKKKK